MAGTLRERQKLVARQSILQAFADEIVEHGVSEVSLQAVADRAGMSPRTLYNYFESREALIEGLLAASQEASTTPDVIVRPDDLDRMPDAIRHYYAAWTAQGNLAKAMAQLAMARVARGGDDLRRPEDDFAGALRDAIAAERPDLDSETAEAIAHVMRLFGSSRTWHRITVEYGVRSDLAAEAATWAFTTLRAALERGDGPATGSAAPH